MGLRHRLERVRRRKWSVAACWLVAGALVVTFLAIRPSSAAARAELLARPGVSQGSTTIAGNRESATALVDAVTSRAVVDDAVARVPGASRSELLSSVVVRRLGTSDRIQITATSRHRARAAQLANGLARAFVESRRAIAANTKVRDVARVDSQLAQLQTRLDELDGETSGTSSSTASAARLAAATTQFKSLEERRHELLRNQTPRNGTVELAVSASGAQSVWDMSPLEVAALGFALFLALAAIAVALRETADERVRSSQEIGRIAGLPVLAEFSRDPKSGKDRSYLAVASSPRSPLSEAARSLRSSIELRDADFRHPTMLITSATAGEGKSLVSANLAAAYAAAGYRTVLIDADLRTPRLSTMFGTYPARLISSHQAVHGLSSLVSAITTVGSERAQLERAALLRTPIDNLLFLPAGPEPANPAELLDSRAMSLLLADLVRIADIVIIDSPPLLPVSDAVGLARHVASVILVASVGTSHRSALRRSRQVLAAHPRVLGVVANRVARKATYASYAPTTARRRSAPETSPALSSVVHTLTVPTPPVGRPDANGDLWIDLSDDPVEYGQPIGSGTLELSSWNR